MLSGTGTIRSLMLKRGFKHARTDEEFTLSGEYGRNLQYVYSKGRNTSLGAIIDMVYFSVDILHEKLVIGFYRENVDEENGIYENSSRSLPLTQFSKEKIEEELNKLLKPIRGII